MLRCQLERDGCSMWTDELHPVVPLVGFAPQLPARHGGVEAGQLKRSRAIERDETESSDAGHGPNVPSHPARRRPTSNLWRRVDDGPAGENGEADEAIAGWTSATSAVGDSSREETRILGGPARPRAVIASRRCSG